MFGHVYLVIQRDTLFVCGCVVWTHKQREAHDVWVGVPCNGETDFVCVWLCGTHKQTEAHDVLAGVPCNGEIYFVLWVAVWCCIH